LPLEGLGEVQGLLAKRLALRLKNLDMRLQGSTILRFLVVYILDALLELAKLLPQWRNCALYKLLGLLAQLLRFLIEDLLRQLLKLCSELLTRLCQELQALFPR
jgi:hypothetical protein